MGAVILQHQFGAQNHHFLKHIRMHQKGKQTDVKSEQNVQQLEGIKRDDLKQNVDQILASQFFARSKRLSGLLKYLLEKYEAGSISDLTEYGIGLDYFKRDPNQYSTNDDPIVRVQIGRLREKLKQYYAANRHISLHIAIPLGTYIPKFELKQCEKISNPACTGVFHEFISICRQQKTIEFADGLNEYIIQGLYQVLGTGLSVSQSDSRAESDEDKKTQAQNQYRIVGKFQLENEQLQVFLRVLSASNDRVLWADQLVTQVEDGLSFKLQQKLSRSIVEKLEAFLTRR